MAAGTATISPENQAELATLLRLVKIGRGSFSFATVRCNSPALRERLIAEVLDRAPAVAVVDLPRGVGDVLGLAKERCASGTPAALFLTGLENSLSSNAGDNETYRVLRALNASRERWPAAFPCPVVFWFPEFAERLLCDVARDLWRWISHYLEFKSDAPDGADRVVSAPSFRSADASNLDKELKLARIAELERRLAEPEPTEDPILMGHRASWLAELGVLFEVLGELDKAEEHYRKALAIHEKLGRLEGMAADYGNLGILYRTRGELDKAEEHYRKALAIAEKLGSLEGMAIQYGNLGLLYAGRGELDKAEEHYRKALAIFEKLGRIEGMANQYGNLGILYATRGELDKAEEHYRKSLAIEEKLGRLEGMASDFGNLGILYKNRGELEKAEEHFRKALAIDEKLGRLEGMAIRYGNLGNLHKERGDMAAALADWRKAVDLFRRLGAAHMVEKIQRWIDAAEAGGGGGGGGAGRAE